jgi:hypothetical protein
VFGLEVSSAETCKLHVVLVVGAIEWIEKRVEGGTRFLVLIIRYKMTCVPKIGRLRRSTRAMRSPNEVCTPGFCSVQSKSFQIHVATALFYYPKITVWDL